MAVCVLEDRRICSPIGWAGITPPSSLVCCAWTAVAATRTSTFRPSLEGEAYRQSARYSVTPRALPRTPMLYLRIGGYPHRAICAKEHRARVDGRATARHLHGIIERTVRCYTAKVSAESAGAVASTMFLESLPTRQSGRLAQPDGGAGTPAGRGCHLQGRSAPPSWTTP